MQACINKPHERKHVPLDDSLVVLDDCKTLKLETCRIKKETTRIICRHYIDCGPQVTEVELYPDHLVWKHDDYRNNCHLIDSCKYEKNDFDNLIHELSALEFSVAQNPSITDGSEECRFSFENGSECYLSFNAKDSVYLSGDYEKVRNIIRLFVIAHKNVKIL